MTTELGLGTMFSFWGFYGAKVMKNFHHLVNVSPNECEDLSLPADDELRIGEGIKKDDFWAGCKSRAWKVTAL